MSIKKPNWKDDILIKMLVYVSVEKLKQEDKNGRILLFGSFQRVGRSGVEGLRAGTVTRNCIRKKK